MSARILHFTLGPVQGFIGDARRTRDLWAGSFLLSWLSGQAMASVKSNGGKIRFPQVDDDELFQAISSGTPDTAPYIGSLPNRFKADVSECPQDIALQAKQAIDAAWRQISDKVWDKYIEDAADQGKGGRAGVRAIWDRQIDNFWHINWVIGQDDGSATDARWLDQRKNWRDVNTGLCEPGDLCRLMGQYQEISGYFRIGEADQQKKFWNAVKNKTGALNLQDNEYLCAIALVKRLFPLIDNAVGWTPGKGTLKIANWPSVSYIAAVPWLQRAKALDNEKQSAYFQTVNENIKNSFMGESQTHLFDLTANGLFQLDGHLLHADGIAQWPADELDGDPDDARRALTTAYKDLCKSVGSTPSEFYACLIMDGDSIGSKIADNEDFVSTGLAKFTASVKAHFYPDNGNPSSDVLIYAGGDDVLALLPAVGAIEAAQALRQAYIEAFDNEEGYTVSAAIIYAQYKIPLQAVLREAHHRLDDIAKDKNGRDSLALAVKKPGGIAYHWVTGWQRNDDETNCVETMLKVATDGFKTDSKLDIPLYSTGFVYNLKARYQPLFDTRHDPDAPLGNGEFAQKDLLTSLIRSDFLAQPKHTKLPGEAIDTAVADILTLGLPTHFGNRNEQRLSDEFIFDGPIMARFLSQQGYGGDEDAQHGSGETS